MTVMFCCAAVEQFGERDGRFGFAGAAGADEHEHADRPARIGQASSRGADALGDRFQGVRLADDPLFHLGFEIQHGLNLVRHHAADRDAGPSGDDIGHRLAIDANLQQRRFALDLAQLGVELVELAAKLLALGGSEGRRSGRFFWRGGFFRRGGSSRSGRLGGFAGLGGSGGCSGLLGCVWLSD